MDLLCLLLIHVLIVTITYWFLTRTFDHWKKQNVPSIPDPLPGFGHMLSVICLKENTPTMSFRMYKHTNASVVGFYFLQKPALVLRDPELIKFVMQSNFVSFSSNLLNLQSKTDPVLSKNPFFVREYEEWKESRNRVGNQMNGKKLKYLYVIIEEVCSKLCAFTDRKIEASSGFYECELKEYFVKYTGEIIANAAFAIEGQSFEDNPDRLAFVNIAKTIFDPTTIHGIKQALLFYMPAIAKLLSVSFLQKKTDSYFRENIKAIVKKRKQSNIKPNDFLQFSLDANNENDLDTIVADIVSFFADVYETTSTTLAVLFYNLSQHMEIQEKLRTHIYATLEANDDKMSYDALKELTYLEQVLFESMRVIPPVGVLMKLCTEDITLIGSDGLTCHVRKGEPVFIPLMALNKDEKYWTDPETFDPERFSPENQADRNKFVFIPFGEGPRMCIGRRLAMMVIKQVVVSLLTRYSIEHSAKTKVPLEMEPTSFLTYVKGGFWAQLKKLKEDRI